MKFDDLDKKMRVYETASDHCILPGIYIVARIDGRGFTALTKKRHHFQTPFDERFCNYMLETAKHLMNCGFSIVYGYVESDEISLLFDLRERAFGRKTRKYNSILAGEASAKFSLLLGDIGVFDCRISELPDIETVVDYFRWRNEDAHRNALNSYCYWFQVKQGMSPRAATSFLSGMSVSDKNEFLFQNGINFNEVPAWQKRGSGLYWEIEEREGENPLTGESAAFERRRLAINCELPMKDQYSDWIRSLVLNRPLTRATASYSPPSGGNSSSDRDNGGNVRYHAGRTPHSFK